ncbi:serine O-acetyltransferase [Phaeodactylibacter luteus]|uniref:Serine acetyltransferase n=1 Tax=Phaeodactylibacter luteus TaxID=1564516 RepID=A0A5C6RU79_9BACT|nr:serine O-acetyltransferase [Phaeodactylibacter luteus]TXB64902.1 serine acetyltransferase [Phaeodactylibacter luteus]
MDEQQFIERLFKSHKDSRKIPSPSEVCNWLNGLLSVMFPELSNHRYRNERELAQYYQQLKLELYTLLETIEDMLPGSARELEEAFLEELPLNYERLRMDAEAILKGDPAAVSQTEVIRTYPGFRAIAVFRLANTFHRLGVPLIPRVLTEHVHGLTGVDIHPGATIGDRFCIDHGTGIVIGETVEIGNDVKIYQGVTLGALSVRKEYAKTKRHPTIEDNVVIYSGATILGGETVIGSGSIIGGNVWITKSVAPGSRVYYKSMEEAAAPSGAAG